MKKKNIFIIMLTILIIFIGINYKNHVDAVKKRQIIEEKGKEENIKKYTEHINDIIGEENKVTYEKPSNKMYITVYNATIDNIDQLVEAYNNSNDEDKNKIKDSISWDKLQQDNMNLYTTLKNDQKDYDVDVGIRIIVNNSIETGGLSPNILMIDNGTITDMLYKEKKKTASASTSQATTAISTKQTYKARFGQFLECNVNGSIAVVKFKIQSSTSNKTTIDQNGYNIEDMILKQGADKYDEIQYWAVADMTDGNESKVISFIVDKDLITKIKNQQVVGNQIVDYAKDVWILPGLRE